MKSTVTSSSNNITISPVSTAFTILQIVKKLKGSDLVGKTYKPMFPYFISLKAAPGSNTGAFRVVSDGYVTSDAGTGIVHQAPFFGEDDYRVCRKFGKITMPPAWNAAFSEPALHYFDRRRLGLGASVPILWRA